MKAPPKGESTAHINFDIKDTYLEESSLPVHRVWRVKEGPMGLHGFLQTHAMVAAGKSNVGGRLLLRSLISFQNDFGRNGVHGTTTRHDFRVWKQFGTLWGQPGRTGVPTSALPTASPCDLQWCLERGDNHVNSRNWVIRVFVG